MLKVIRNRHSAVGIIILFYLATVTVLSAIAARIAPPEKSWNILAYGLFLSAFGSIATLLIFRSFEQNFTSRPLIQEPKEEEAVPLQEEKEDNTSLLEAIIEEKEKQISESQTTIAELENQHDEQQETIKQFKKESERLQEEVRSLTHHFNSYKEETEATLTQNHVLGEEYQKTITDQRTVIKKKQKQILQLEEKVNDLNYEIKTLLELNDSFKQKEPSNDGPASRPISERPIVTLTNEKQARSITEASNLLKRCLNIAQKITGAHHYSASLSKFKDINIQNFALDKRRLFDSLRSENTSTVLVYAPRENKLLFVNNQAKSLLGWSPEKFALNFHELVQEGLNDWKRGISRLSSEPEVEVRLLIRTKQGQDILVHSLLGMIPTGLFKGHVIGILYQA